MRFLSRSMIMSRPRSEATAASSQAYRFHRLRDGWAQRQPVSANPLPLLNQHTVSLKEAPNAGSIPPDYFFENRRQHSQSTRAENGSLRNLRNMRRLRNRNGETIARIQLQHHVNIGAAISRIDNVVRAHHVLSQQLV